MGWSRVRRWASRSPATLLLALVLLFTLTSCKDPQHGAYKIPAIKWSVAEPVGIVVFFLVIAVWAAGRVIKAGRTRRAEQLLPHGNPEFQRQCHAWAAEWIQGQHQ